MQSKSIGEQPVMILSENSDRKFNKQSYEELIQTSHFC